MNDAAFAVTIDGDILANVTHADGPKDVKKLLARALTMGGKVFIGVVLTPAEKRFAMRWTDDAAAEVGGWIWGARQRRRRGR